MLPDSSLDPGLQPATTLTLAPQACASCRKQKRKCDKQLPSCGLCQRIGRVCDYSTNSGAGAPSPDEFHALREKVANLEDLLAGKARNESNDAVSSNGTRPLSSNLLFPGSLATPAPAWPAPMSSLALFFLDSNAFEYERFQIQPPIVRVPPGALSVLGSSLELRPMVGMYFCTVHSYFPVISKIRLYQHLASPQHEPGADVALLFLAMKLASTETSEGNPRQTQLYQDTKSFYNYMETQNGHSIHTIQALLLLALYEIGHAIYPAAYLTIGQAARLGHAMGLQDRGVPQMLPRPLTWTEQEERRRVWWGVVILDRFVNAGHRGKPLASADPSLDTHLPTDDSSWDNGHMLVAAPLALSASQTIKAAPFARTCQAGHLLGKVIQHVNDRRLPVEYRFDEALQLNRTVRALAGLLPEEAEEDISNRLALCTNMAICYSALLTLYDAYSCTERAVENAPESQLLMQKGSIEGLREVSAMVMDMARRIRELTETMGFAKLSPLVLDALYQAAASYAWYKRETSDPACGERLAELQEIISVLDRRWRVAGEYLRIIEATEFHLQGDIR